MPLSIVIPCLNEAGGIVAALEPLQPLRRRGAEVIVVDGGSTDASAALAAPLADRVVAAPRGRASQMNAGAAAATGAVLLFLHADCTLPANADQLISECLATRGDGWGRFDVQLTGQHPMLRVVSAMMNWRSRLTGIATGDQGIFVTRDLFAAAGGFPAIPLMEDVALSAILKKQSHPICIGQRIAASGRRWERHGMTRTIILMGWLRLRYYCGADPSALAVLYDPRRR
jgi:rSAM/selenodomain-associated transferase 2